MSRVANPIPNRCGTELDVRPRRKSFTSCIPMHSSLPVVIKHELGHGQIFDAKASRERIHVRKAENQGEDSAAQGEVQKNSSSQDLRRVQYKDRSERFGVGGIFCILG